MSPAFLPTSSRSSTKECQEIVVRDDVMGNAADSEDEALVFNAKRHEGRKRAIRKSTLRRRKTPTQESTSQGFSLPAAAPQVLWLLETGQAGIWEPDVDIWNPSPQISLPARIWADKTLPGAGESSSGAGAVNHPSEQSRMFPVLPIIAIYPQLLKAFFPKFWPCPGAQPL